MSRHGPPSEALDLVEVDEPVPGWREVLVRVAASVGNYNEVDACHGRYLTVNPPLPYTLGMELVGEVVAAGPEAEGWIGKRVMTSGRGAQGAHAELAVGSVAMTFEAPGDLDDAQAAASSTRSTSPTSGCSSAAACGPGRPSWSTPRPAVSARRRSSWRWRRALG